MSAMPGNVRAVFEGYPEGVRAVLLAARDLVFEVAEDGGCGTLDEVLRWGQPSYVCKTGTTLRLAPDKGAPAVMVHCQTDLVDRFRSEHPDAFRFGGTRALYLEAGFDRDALALFLARALTYRRVRRKARA